MNELALFIIRKNIVPIVVCILLVGMTIGAAIFVPNVNGSQLMKGGTRSDYTINIEVDSFEGLLTQEVMEAFEFLESYFEARGIQTTIDFNSSQNVIGGNPYIDSESWRSLSRQYHDQPSSIYYMICKRVNGMAGGANPLWGAALGLELANLYDVRFLVMHEFGHCVGIGLQDDTENEVYSSSGFMGYYYPNITAYSDQDWNSSFAPDGTFGNFTWKQARIWRQYSVFGQIFDDTSDVKGTVITHYHTLIFLREIDGPDEYVTYVNGETGVFNFQPSPGNYSLEVDEGYAIVGQTIFYFGERETIDLGTITIEAIPQESPEQVPPLQDNRLLYLGAMIGTASVLVLAFAARLRRNDKGHGLLNHKIIAAIAIASVLIMVPSSYFWSQNDLYSAVSVNELFDDMIDKNGDGAIDQNDAPLEWHSYGQGDRVLVRDRINAVWYESYDNQTYISLVDYTGIYGDTLPIRISVPGNATSAYSMGDILLVQNYMVEYSLGSLYPEFNNWIIAA